jgi:hypothetical protein
MEKLKSILSDPKSTSIEIIPTNSIDIQDFLTSTQDLEYEFIQKAMFFY